MTRRNRKQQSKRNQSPPVDSGFESDSEESFTLKCRNNSSTRRHTTTRQATEMTPSNIPRTLSRFLVCSLSVSLYLSHSLIAEVAKVNIIFSQIVGLGNTTHPGTRHNVGMMAVDALVESMSKPTSSVSQYPRSLSSPSSFSPQWTTSRSAQGEYASIPMTFMPNVSSSNRKTKKGKRKQQQADDKSSDGEDSVNDFQQQPTSYEAEMLFFKPKGFMNLSGGPVLKACKLAFPTRWCPFKITYICTALTPPLSLPLTHLFVTFLF
jgi:hypothetical protein